MKGKKVQRFTNVLFYACAILLGASLVMRFSGDIVGNGTFFSLSLAGFTVFHLIRLIKFGVRKRGTYHWAYSIVLVLMAVVLFSKYQYWFFGHYLGLVVIPLFGLMALHYLLVEKERDRRTSILMGAFFLLVLPLFMPQFKEAPVPYIPWWIEMGSTVEKERFESGQLKEQYGTRNRVNHGRYRTFYKKGQLKEKGWYVDGMRNGTFREYYENGNLKHKGKYRNGKRHGRHFWFTTKEDTKTVADYRNGVLHGGLKKFHPNGTLKSKMKFDNGKRIGVSKTFYDDGSKKGILNYSNGKQEGEAKFLYRDGKLKARSFAVEDSVIFYQEYDKAGDTIETLRSLVIIGPDTVRLSKEEYIAKAYFGGMDKGSSVMMETRVISAEDYETAMKKGWAFSRRDTVQIKNGVGKIIFELDSPILPYYHFSVRGEFKGINYYDQKEISVENGDEKNFKAYRDSSI